MGYKNKTIGIHNFGLILVMLENQRIINDLKWKNLKNAGFLPKH